LPGFLVNSPGLTLIFQFVIEFSSNNILTKGVTMSGIIDPDEMDGISGNDGDDIETDIEFDIEFKKFSEDTGIAQEEGGDEEN